jgi:hypothetical protein
VTNPDPGANNRTLVRTALAQWLDAQHILGVDKVHQSQPPVTALDEYRTGEAAYSCQMWVRLPEDQDTQISAVGPDGINGRALHYEVHLTIWHRSYEPGALDWSDDEDDYDRIVGAIKDALHGRGRDLGRPDAIFAVALRQGGIRGSHEEPLNEDGVVDREGTLRFAVTQMT